MDAHDEHDDLTDDDEVTAHRDRAASMLDRIAQQVKQALADAAINIDIFIMVPNSGRSILVFGTPGDPDDRLWNRVSDVVGSIVAQSIGLDRVRCREVQCASTDDLRQPAGADGATRQ